MLEFDEPQTLVCGEHWEEVGPFCPTNMGIEAWMRVWTGLAHNELMKMEAFRRAVEEKNMEEIARWLPACCKLTYQTREQLLAETIRMVMGYMDRNGELPHA